VANGSTVVVAAEKSYFGFLQRSWKPPQNQLVATSAAIAETHLPSTNDDQLAVIYASCLKRTRKAVNGIILPLLERRRL
jgi:hypothetical protein